MLRQLVEKGRKTIAARFPRVRNLPAWSTRLATNPGLWEEAKKRSREGPPVLLATTVGGLEHASVLESVLAVALTLRHANVHILLCDSMLPGCQRAEIALASNPGVLERYELPRVLCADCTKTGETLYAALGLHVHYLSQLITPGEARAARQMAQASPCSEAASLRFEGVAVGEHAYAGALRYFAKGNLSDERDGEIVLQRYLEAALLMVFAMRRLLREQQFSSACFHHGIYVPQGLVGEVCRQTSVRVVNWNPAYRKNCFIFSHSDTYHHTLLTEPTQGWEEMDWGERQEEEILAYLYSRWQGARDWIWFHEKPDEDMERFAAEAGLNPAKPCIGLLTNVIWDAQLHYQANAFPDMLTWVLETLRYFSQRPDLQLLIRVHPAEIRGTMRSRQPLIRELQRALPTLPANVFLIPPESSVSTYAAMKQCNAVLIYGTKMGVELASMGIPVIVAGEAWIRNKGITLDAASPAEYQRLLESLPLPGQIAPDLLQRARRYAFHFFFRRMIPLPFIVPLGQYHRPPYAVAVQRLEELLPGVSAGLDIICDGILTGAPFIYPAERVGVHDVE
jgi:hypothetical protein